MKATKNCLDLIMQFEGFQEKTYICPAGILTIGYGHTKEVTKDMVCTKEQAIEWLKDDLAVVEETLNNLMDDGLELNANQFDALCSFIFNVGNGAFKKSTLLKFLLKGQYEEASKEFLKWNKASGKELSGLTKRRQAEQDLFLS